MHPFRESLRGIVVGWGLFTFALQAQRVEAQQCYLPPRSIQFSRSYQIAAAHLYRSASQQQLQGVDNLGRGFGYFGAETVSDSTGVTEHDVQQFVQKEVSDNTWGVIAECLYALCQQAEAPQTNSATVATIGGLCSTALGITGAGAGAAAGAIIVAPPVLSVTFTSSSLNQTLQLRNPGNQPILLGSSPTTTLSEITIVQFPQRLDPQRNENLGLRLLRPTTFDRPVVGTITLPSAFGSASTTIPVILFADEPSSWPAPSIRCGTVASNGQAQTTDPNSGGIFNSVPTSPAEELMRDGDPSEREIGSAYADHTPGGGGNGHVQTFAQCQSPDGATIVRNNSVTRTQMTLRSHLRSRCGRIRGRGLVRDAPSWTTTAILPGDPSKTVWRLVATARVDRQWGDPSHYQQCHVNLSGKVLSLAPTAHPDTISDLEPAGEYPISVRCDQLPSGLGCWMAPNQDVFFDGSVDVIIEARRVTRGG